MGDNAPLHTWLTSPSQLPRILGMQPVDVDYVVEDTIVEGCMHLIAGRPGSMKSYWALAMCKAIAQGEYVTGKATKQTDVVYVDLENPQNLVQERFQTLGITDDSRLNYMASWSGVATPPPIEGYEGSLYALWAKTLRPVFVFDSLTRFHTHNENKADEIKHTMHALRHLCDMGATVIIIHHDGKEQPEGGIHHGYRGSTEILAACDIAYTVVKTEETSTTTTVLVKGLKNRFNIQQPITLKFDGETGQFMPTEAAIIDNAKQVNDMNRFLMSLPEGTPLTRTQLVDIGKVMCGTGPSTVDRWVKGFKKVGLIEGVERGVFMRVGDTKQIAEGATEVIEVKGVGE